MRLYGGVCGIGYTVPMTNNTQPVGRPYSPTDLDHPLIASLGHVVDYGDGDARDTLGNVTADGMATLVRDGFVVAVVPIAEVALPTDAELAAEALAQEMAEEGADCFVDYHGVCDANEACDSLMEACGLGSAIHNLPLANAITARADYLLGVVLGHVEDETR